MIYNFKKFIIFFFFIGFNTIYSQGLEWAKSFGGFSSDGSSSIAVDNFGNVYTCGFFLYSVDFDPGPQTCYLYTNGWEDVFIQKLDASGNFLWAKSFGGVAVDICNSITTDASGCIYSTGSFRATVDFDPGTGSTYITSAGEEDIFIHKMDSSGHFLWVRTIGGAYYDVSYSMDVDKFGNIYITGNYKGTVDFDPGVGIYNLTSIGNTDIFVLKMDSSGNFLWARSFGGTNSDGSNSIVIDNFGNVYVAGYFKESADFDGGLGINILISEGSSDVFVLKMDSSGVFLWARSFGGTDGESAYSLVADATGNVYTTGFFTSNYVDFDPGAGICSLNSQSNSSIFIQKMDASGNFLWARAYGSTLGISARAISLDYMGDVFLAGYFEGTMYFDSALGGINLTSKGDFNDIFISKIDSLGNFLWAKSFGGASNIYCTSMFLDTMGILYITGSFLDTLDFDLVTGSNIIVSKGADDVYVLKMSRTTELKEVKDAQAIIVFPNPAKESLQLYLEKELYNVKLVISDLLGKVIFASHYNTLLSTSIGLPYAKGIYFLTIQTKDSNKTIKFIKE